MKKIISTMALVSICGYTTAQNQIETYSVYDVNHDNITSVADATKVVSRAIEEIRIDPQVVDAVTINALLLSIEEKLNNLNQKIEGVKDRLNYVMKESNISNPFELDENGILSNGHEYVDLGIVVDGKPVYWATRNIGADSPADYGLYFAWGETVGYTGDTNDGRSFDWVSYSSDLCGGTSTTLKKYCTDSSYGAVDNKTVLDPEDDAAHVNWQGSWRMPTKEELDALRTQCTWTWTRMTNSEGKSKSGYIVSNKTDSSKIIFLPATGYSSTSNSHSFYWSSSLLTSYNSSANCLVFIPGLYDFCGSSRCHGQSVRPVCQ